jgi:hypothetical protein
VALLKKGYDAREPGHQHLCIREFLPNRKIAANEYTGIVLLIIDLQVLLQSLMIQHKIK